MSELVDEVEVKWLGEWYTNVADISGIDVLGELRDGGSNTSEDLHERASVEVVVVGVGMEIVRLNLDGDGESGVE